MKNRKGQKLSRKPRVLRKKKIQENNQILIKMEMKKNKKPKGTCRRKFI